MISLHKEGINSLILSLALLFAFSFIMFWLFGINAPTIILSSLFLLFFLFVAYFFREPHRECKAVEKGEVLSSADGKVVIVKEVYEEEFLKSKAIQVSVFMSLFDVHVNYFPIEGKVLYRKDHPGKYLVAWHPKSSIKNERTTTALECEEGVSILIRQIAGYVARRIVCYAEEGGKFRAGAQLGFIKFGSRVDFFLPIGSQILVKKGDRVKACQTLIAKL